MKIDELNTIAQLARLKIDPKEADTMLSDFNRIMEYVDKVKELNTKHIEAQDIYINHENATRKDEPSNTLTRDDIAKFAPQFENGFVVVPRVIEV